MQRYLEKCQSATSFPNIYVGTLVLPILRTLIFTFKLVAEPFLRNFLFSVTTGQLWFCTTAGPRALDLWQLLSASMLWPVWLFTPKFDELILFAIQVSFLFFSFSFVYDLFSAPTWIWSTHASPVQCYSQLRLSFSFFGRAQPEEAYMCIISFDLLASFQMTYIRV